MSSEVPANLCLLVRNTQELTQQAFADKYGLTLGTICGWEQSRRKPDRTAWLCLQLIHEHPELVAATVLRLRKEGKYPVSGSSHEYPLTEKIGL